MSMKFKVSFRSNGFLTVVFGTLFLKVALTKSSYRSLQVEKRGHFIAKLDSFWCKYVLDGFFFFNVSVFPVIHIDKQYNIDLKEFFKEKNNNYERTIEIDVIRDFLKENDIFSNENVSLIERLTEIPSCKLHGDFHIDNVLIGQDGNIIVIDWELFPQIGDYRFDIIQYAIYNINPNSWVDGLKKLSSSLKMNNYDLDGINLNKDVILNFGLWKIQVEIKKNNMLRGKSSQSFNRKYLTAFHDMKEIYNRA